MLRKNPDALALGVLGLLLLPLSFFTSETRSVSRAWFAERTVIRTQIQLHRNVVRDQIRESIRTAIQSIRSR